MEKKHQLNLTYLLIAFLLLLVFQSFWSGYSQTETIPYSQFQELLKNKQIEKVVVGPSQIEGQFKTPPNGKKYFTTTRVDPAVADELEKYGVTFTGSTGHSLLTDILSWV
ncbi:MAG: ATP-dependent metallopeptidase FtsH/Yme1/Tma family protein, partial [Rhodomicrobium sp.]